MRAMEKMGRKKEERKRGGGGVAKHKGKNDEMVEARYKAVLKVKKRRQDTGGRVGR